MCASDALGTDFVALKEYEDTDSKMGEKWDNLLDINF